MVRMILDDDQPAYLRCAHCDNVLTDARNPYTDTIVICDECYEQTHREQFKDELLRHLMKTELTATELGSIRATVREWLPALR